jgi:hypothetical protein
LNIFSHQMRQMGPRLVNGDEKLMLYSVSIKMSTYMQGSWEQIHFGLIKLHDCAEYLHYITIYRHC